MRRYPTARMPYEPIFVKGNTLSIDLAAAKRFILFTGHKDKLTGHNEYALDPRIQTGFGIGINDSAMPFENGVGTLRLLNDPTDNVWLTKIDGSGKGKVLTSGYLQANNHLTVDKTNHTITEEFIIRNYGPGTDVHEIDDCSSVDGWSIYAGARKTLTADTALHLSGTTNSNNILALTKDFTQLNFSNIKFVMYKIRPSVDCVLYFQIRDIADTYKHWDANRPTTRLTANVWNTVVIPVHAPVGTTGILPASENGTINMSAIKYIRIGVTGAGSLNDVTIDIDDIVICNGTWAQVEVAVPDNLHTRSSANTGTEFSFYSGSSYNWVIGYNANKTTGLAFPDDIEGSGTYFNFLDGTNSFDIQGDISKTMWSNIIALYPVSTKSTTISKSYGYVSTIAYSSNSGTQKRIGFDIQMPPSDNGRTGINQCRLKLITYYDQLGETTHEFSKDLNYSTGIDLIKKPFFAFYDPVGRNVEYYIITKKPIGGSYKYNETGNISNITFQLDPNTRVYRGQIKHVNLTRDSDADMIPDFLDSNEAVSIEHLIGHLNFIK